MQSIILGLAYQFRQVDVVLREIITFHSFYSTKSNYEVVSVVSSRVAPTRLFCLACWLTQGPFKCYITFFPGYLTPTLTLIMANANNIEHYTFVTLFMGNLTPSPTALRNPVIVDFNIHFFPF